MIERSIVGGVLLVTLLVVAIGLALSATESRDERDILAAVGARPSAMTRVAGYKAGLMALLGGLLAVPVGLVPATVVWHAFDSDSTPVVVPWLAIAAVVIAIPALAAVGAWASSSVAQRVRPLSMSTLIRD